MVDFRSRGACGLLLSMSLFCAPSVPAQVSDQLDQIVVTAQRRAQSLQEVPISIEAITGEEIRNQGFRNMDQLADFSPSILIDNRLQDQDIAIRGIGTTGNNLTLEQAAPTFVDGIHFGRTSQIKNAFLDLERVEVLRGPQPVYFGQNATAGAFSLVTRKPGATWEGDLNVEIGNFGRRTIEGGVGGPLTETLGIRVAGKWDELEGYLTDVISGDRFPSGRDYAGRVILEWTPNSRFRATAKAQVSDFNGGGDGAAVALSGQGHPGDVERSVLIDGLEEFDLIPLTGSLSDGLGVRTGTRFMRPPPYIRQEDADSGNVDIRHIACEIRAITEGVCGGRENIDPWDAYLDLSYTLGSGIELTSLTGFSHLKRSYIRDNSLSPFLMNFQSRQEDYDSLSQELRITSDLGGTIEWMVGLYWQKTDLDLLSDNMRANVRTARRLNTAVEDAEWKSVFATLTWNFPGDKAAIDIGGRYTHVRKETSVVGYGASWIFDIEPVSLGVEGVDYLAVDGGWTVPYDEVRDVPPEWISMAPVGITPLDASLRPDEAHSGVFDDDDFNPQVTFRYRPNENVATYFRWAQAFKAGGFDTGSASLPESQEEFEFLSEHAENWEIGVKGDFRDGRARANASLFWMEVDDLQLATTSIDPEGMTSQGSFNTNAGLQRVRGLEVDVTALLTERLTVGVNAALMDGEMVEFEGAGCTDAELAVADTGPCISEEESIALVGDDSLEGLIDRSGYEAPRTPDWVVTANVDYRLPVGDAHRIRFSGLFKASDGYITNVEDFALDIKMNRHEDMNLSIGYGDAEETWEIAAWGRNLLEPLPSYNAEFDVRPEGLISTNLSASHFRTYGVQFTYNYQ
jgi:outer membrane receptor protein involved in Fe transport